MLLYFNLFVYAVYTILQVPGQEVSETTSSSDTTSIVCFNFDNFVFDTKLSNVVGEVTVSNILRHTRILVTDNTSALLIRQVFTNIREVLTSETGGRNLVNIIGNVGSVLRDDSGSTFVQSACKLAEAIAADQESVNKIFRSVATTVVTVLSHENAQPAFEGLTEGLKLYFSQLTSEKVDEGISQLKKYREDNLL